MSILDPKLEGATLTSEVLGLLLIYKISNNGLETYNRFYNKHSQAVQKIAKCLNGLKI